MTCRTCGHLISAPYGEELAERRCLDCQNEKSLLQLLVRVRLCDPTLVKLPRELEKDIDEAIAKAENGEERP